jgi:TorA maturation chaperone TorD
MVGAGGRETPRARARDARQAEVEEAWQRLTSFARRHEDLRDVVEEVMRVWVEQLWPDEQRLGQFAQRMTALTGDKDYQAAFVQHFREQNPDWFLPVEESNA